MQRTAFFWILLAVAARPAWSLVSTNVPLGHWSYDAVEKLANYGLIESSMLTIRPVTRVEMARHVAQARYALGHLENPPQVLEAIVGRLEEEFAEELILLGLRDGAMSDSSLKPIEDPYVGYLYARDRADLENRRGDVFERGSNYRAGFASRGRLFDLAAFYLHPEYAGASGRDGDVDLVEGYGTVMVGPLEIEGGKDSLWWGPGYHGSLLMSNNAVPFTMIKVTNPEPWRLPWLLQWLGLFKGEWFLAELEEDRDVPRAKLTGLRLNFKPHPALEFGVSRVILYGGRGMPSVGLGDYVQMFFRSGEQVENDQLAGFDLSVLVPLGRNWPMRSVRFYGDAAGEDEAHSAPNKWGSLLGLQFNDLLQTGRTDLRIEYANNHVPGHPDVFYTHSLYTSGYTYDGRVIGHHMGTDSSDLFVQLTHYLTDRMVLELAYDREQHNLSARPQPTENILASNLLWFLSRDWRIKTGYRYEDKENQVGDDNHIVYVELVRRF